MQAFKLSIFEYPVLPSVLKPMTVYFVKDGANAQTYVTDRSATAINVGNSSFAAPPSIGGGITGATPGSVLFASTGPVFDQDNSKLFFHKTNSYLGIGTNSPTRTLHAVGNGLILSSNYTATANNDAGWKFSGSLTARNTAADAFSGMEIKPTMVASANNQTHEAVRIEPTFTSGAFAGLFQRALRVIGQVMINTPTLNTPNNYAFSMRSLVTQGMYIEGLSSVQILLQAGALNGGDGKVTLRAGNDNNSFLQFGNAVLRGGGGGAFAMGNTNFSPTAVLDLAASTVSVASLRIRSGVAPSAPNDGDIWYDGTNIKMRIGATTKTFTLT